VLEAPGAAVAAHAGHHIRYHTVSTVAQQLAHAELRLASGSRPLWRLWTSTTTHTTVAASYAEALPRRAGPKEPLPTGHQPRSQRKAEQAAPLVKPALYAEAGWNYALQPAQASMLESS
jgi:hypothetical protein